MTMEDFHDIPSCHLVIKPTCRVVSVRLNSLTTGKVYPSRRVGKCHILRLKDEAIGSWD